MVYIVLCESKRISVLLKYHSRSAKVYFLLVLLKLKVYSKAPEQ